MNRRFSSSISKVSNGAATPRGDQAGTEVNPPAFTALFSPYLQKFLSSQPEYRRESVRATGMPRLSHDRLQSSATPAETLAPDLLQRRASQTNLSTQQQGNGNEHPMSQPEDTLLSLEDYYMVPSTIKKQSTASPSDFENYANEHVHPHMTSSLPRCPEDKGGIYQIVMLGSCFLGEDPSLGDALDSVRVFLEQTRTPIQVRVASSRQITYKILTQGGHDDLSCIISHSQNSKYSYSSPPLQTHHIAWSHHTASDLTRKLLNAETKHIHTKISQPSFTITARKISSHSPKPPQGP
ncbi:hypothetical protein DL95DRAFT_403244 [Leptodontidium sp. 2 PMI_412]|nr:hypothetical protein DL95DRAFT_403244 [Leptodontidium sp. 2 PMI_412]